MIIGSIVKSFGPEIYEPPQEITALTALVIECPKTGKRYRAMVAFMGTDNPEDFELLEEIAEEMRRIGNHPVNQPHMY